MHAAALPAPLDEAAAHGLPVGLQVSPEAWPHPDVRHGESKHPSHVILEVGQNFGPNYTLTRFLGRGSFATVWGARPNNGNGPFGTQEIAVKIFGTVDASWTQLQAHENAEAERAVLLKLNAHPTASTFVTQLLGAGPTYLFLTLEEGVTLDVLMRSRLCRGLQYAELHEMGASLLHCLDFMHNEVKILHRDVKPGNIFVSPAGIKLGDFGLSCSDGEQQNTDYVHTRWYRAPEVLMSCPHGSKADVWAAGCVLYEMYAGRPLFPGKCQEAQLLLIVDALGAIPSSEISKLSVPLQKACRIANRDSAKMDQPSLQTLVCESLSAHESCTPEIRDEFLCTLTQMLHVCVETRHTALSAGLTPFFSAEFDTPTVFRVALHSTQFPTI
jgi:serine/threonine protein kinase